MYDAQFNIDIVAIHKTTSGDSVFVDIRYFYLLL